MHDIFSLDQYNQQLTDTILTTKQSLEHARDAAGYLPQADYLFEQIKHALQIHIDNFLATRYPELPQFPCLIHWIQVDMFQADLTIKFDTQIVRTLGKAFAGEFLPQVVTSLQEKQEYLGLIKIEQKGIYINVTLTPTFWSDALAQIFSLGDQYGDIDTYAHQVALIEYSSPNAAKHLHAGHVRSTVIGAVLSNLYRHVGYTVHRINHINDRGGFGQLIVGWRRRHALLSSQGLQDNDLNYQIYSLYRSAEKLSTARDPHLAQHIISYFPHHDQTSFQQQFTQFQEEAKTAFHALESGDPEMFQIWKEIVTTSKVSFQDFYDQLGIDHDYTIGESFYEKIGRQCITLGKEKGIIIHFTAATAQQYRDDYQQAHSHEDPLVQQQKQEEIFADVGADVVMLDNRERFVVLRSDGASIYATRDLGCLWRRCHIRDPSVIVYEVGQEQADHFAKLFETGKKLGRLQRSDGSETLCLHIGHGFYVDATSKKKLSSRAGASNVHTLISASIAYFKEKYVGSIEFTPEEIAHNARTLGIASIIIHDLSKNRMDPVLVDTDLEKTIHSFEQSGGAYLIYTICRAKSLLHKATIEYNIPPSSSTERTHQQITLMQFLTDFPAILEKSVLLNEPSIIVNFGYQLTQSFNTMYGSTDRIIDNIRGLQLTKAYIHVMTNILRICTIEPLERM